MTIEQDIVDDINKKYAKSSCLLDLKEFPEHKAGFLSTGSICLDRAIAKGVPFGRITEISGWESVGKSVIGAYLLAECQRKKGIAVLLDTEYAMLPKWAEILSINTKKLIMIEPDNLQDAFDKILWTANIVKEKDVPCCIVWDSISGMPTKEEVETDEVDANKIVGVHARIISRNMRKLSKVVFDRKIALVIISQLREKPMQMFGAPTASIGGHAIPYHSAVRLQLSKKGFLYKSQTGDKGDPIGLNFKAVVIKNKLGSPFKSADIDLYYETGFDEVRDIMLYGVKKGHIIYHKGGWYEYKGKKYREKEFAPAYKDEIEKGILKKEFDKEVKKP